MPLLLATLSLFMLLLNLALTWVPYLFVLAAGTEFYGTHPQVGSENLH